MPSPLLHHSIAEWMVANPTAPRTECAAALGVSVSTIYSITATDLFKDYLHGLAEATFARSFPSLREKIAAVAEASLDKLAEHVADSQNPDYTLQVADKMLHRLGYAPSKGPTEVYLGPKHNNGTTVVTIPRDLLAAAREKVINHAAPLALEAAVDVVPASSPAALPAS